MSQKTTVKKKRLKICQDERINGTQVRRDDSDIAKYFKDVSSFAVTGHLENNANHLLKNSVILEDKEKEEDKDDATVKFIHSKPKIHSNTSEKKESLFVSNCTVPSTEHKIVLMENTSNTTSHFHENMSHSNLSSTSLSASKTQKSSESFKNQKNNIFNNVTQSFNSSKILSLQTSRDNNSQQHLELSKWGLPPLILQKYHDRGIKTMFPWQVECLANENILGKNKNLVYSAPTSAGKTLVAEILIFKTVLERRKKAIFILPFVSVVREKMFYFQDLLSDSGVRVEGFMGGIAPAGGFSAVHVAIATIEKANSLINRLMEDGDLVTLGAVVIDELHLLGDPSRGYLLELLLTKLRYMTLSLENIEIQLIGMSATLPNLALIAEWLDAELYKTEFRPIPLLEQCKIGSSVYDSKFNVARQLEQAPDIINDSDNIIQLCIETINGGHGVLIFCPTKNWCEKLAVQIAATFFQLGRDNTPNGQILRKNIDSTAVQEILAQLKSCPVGLDNVLNKTISFGVAFHHAGLTMDERDIIEGGFRVGSLKVLIATSTLSSGVNLPARRVIIRTPIFNGKPLDKLSYQQMIGRAGRMGKDTAGESILICKESERATAMKLMNSSLEPIVSCLESSGPLIRALLEAIASRIVRTPKDLEFYSQCTFVHKCDDSEMKVMVEEAVQFLVANEFLEVKETEHKEQRMVATCLGKACLSASVPPRDGLFLFEELQRARKCFVLDTELHVIYLVTPFNAGSQIGQIDWMNFLELWRALSESERRVGQLVGVEERFLMTAMRGIVKPGKSLNVHRRFYTALALHDLVREVPLNVVCRKYNCCRGLLQSLQQSSSTFAGMVTNFCKELKWDCMELLFAQFQTRLQFGVCRDLLDLLRLPSLNGLRARSLYKQGITSVAELAVANELDVEEALNKALPFESEKDFDGKNEAEAIKRTKMRTVFITGKDGLTAHEAALIVIKEARVLLKNELGVRDVQWNQSCKITDQENSGCSFIINASTSLRPLNLTNEIPPSQSSSFKVHQITTEANIHQIDIVPREEGTNVTVTTEKSITLAENTVNENDKLETILKSNCSKEIKDFTKIQEDIENSNIAEKMVGNITKNEEKLSTTNQRLSIPCEDIINSSDKQEDASKTLRSKLAERTKSLIKEAHMTICTIDFEEKMDCSIAEKVVEKNKKSSENTRESIENCTNSRQVKESFQVSDRILDEVAKAVEGEHKDVFQMPALVATGKHEEEKKRVSGCSNQSKSPSLFSDSSFLDAQICSILEKNVIETCFTDLEKSNFTPQNQAQVKSIESKNIKKQKNDATTEKSAKNSEAKNVPKESNCSTDGTQLYENQKSELKHISALSTNWTEDSWDETNKSRLQPSKKKEITIIDENRDKTEKQSPSLLQSSRIRGRAKPPLATTQKVLNKIQASICKENQSPDSPLIGSPKPILRKRVYENNDTAEQHTPIGRAKIYNIRSLLGSNASPSSNKSDSEDSIVSSQTVDLRKTMYNKTRSRIEKKKIFDSEKNEALPVKSKISTMKLICDAYSKIVKQNTDHFSENSTSSDDDDDDDDDESCLMFDSDDAISSQPKKSKIIKTNQPSAFNGKILNSKSCTSVENSNNDEKIHPSSVKPINVAISKRTFRLFRAKVEGEAENGQQCDFAVALVTESHVRDSGPMIGSKIVSIEDKKRIKKSSDAFVYADKKICGIVFCWGASAIYYMPFFNTQDAKVTIKERMSFLRDILTNPSYSLRCFNVKEVYKMLYTCCQIESRCEFLDPITADWLLNSENVYKSYTEMAAQYFPKAIDIANSYENNFGMSLAGSGRATVKALLAWYITNVILEMLKNQSSTLLSIYKEIEMPVIKILANMELRGLAINTISLQELSIAMKNDLSRIEEKAFNLAGRKFNFYSSKEVSQVLGLNKKGRVCTNKNVLKSCENPISELVTLWRKINTVQTKIVFPLLSVEKTNNRVHGNCITHTVTGRVSMHEPNLQTIPRDFKSDISDRVFSVRMAFVPSTGNIMLSADFCQLELRILAHFSQDPVLCKLLHQDGDIFKNIAARLNKVTEDMVDDEMRQRAKQLCYAMIYGMGAKSLAQTLSVSESEAKDYLEAFMGTYKGVRVWLNSVYEQVRINGYVSTLQDRRRILPGINSKILAAKSQAERQAVNTKVQGSAADITKKSMVLIEKKLREAFPDMPIAVPTAQNRRKLQSSDANLRSRGAYLMLQLHDELLYEVNSNDLEVVAKIVKESMENAFKLRVPLPVKMKIGTAWGNLEEYKI